MEIEIENIWQVKTTTCQVIGVQCMINKETYKNSIKMFDSLDTTECKKYFVELLIVFW